MELQYDPQRDAIETIDCNIAVNAGAGTGKTKVLTERFVHILENGNLEVGKEVESIVAITFTKKATQEMVERIRKELRMNFHRGEKWTRFYRDMEKSNISTIHSFCGKILRENPIEGKIDPLFQVLDESISANLLNESIEEAIDLSLKDENFFKFLLKLKEYRTESLKKDIREVYNLVRTVGISFRDVKGLTMDFVENLKIDDEDIKTIKDSIIYLQGKLTKASNIVKLREDPLWISFLEGETRDDDLFDVLDYIKSKIGRPTKETDIVESLKEALDKVLICKEKDYKWMYLSILDLLILVDDLYNEKKKMEVGLDYDDLQIKLLSLLDDDRVREKYQERYRYIMIDEFQDTNELQKKIFYKLCSSKSPLDMNNLFVVGDPKQSIYAFRGADIGVFYDVLKDIEKTTGKEAITLSKNYRSVDTVLNFINGIFGQLMEDRYDSLTPVKESLNLIDVEVLEDNGLERNSEESILFEADLIARRIRNLVEKGTYTYKDFALLFRATTRNFYYEEALKNYNIPYFNSSSRQFFKRQEILDIINALKLISNPYDLVSSIGFLRGPMGSLSDDTIFMCLKNLKFNLFNTIKEYFENPTFIISDDEENKLKTAYELLEYMYEIKDILSTERILERLLEKTNFIEGHLLMNKGKQALANIYKFQDMVLKFEANSTKSLEDFIDYLEMLKDEAESEGVIESEDADVVKLLTIHKSKGLQFPVVIIPEMSKDIRSFYPRFLFSKDIGIGFKIGDIRGKYDLIKNDLDKKDLEERKRLLYVAMTRAKNLLILGNQGKDRGFKSMIRDFLNPDKFRLIKNVEINKETNNSVKLLELNSTKNPVKSEEILPLMSLTKIPNRKFERYNISQFLSYKTCPRAFYYDYYKKLQYSMNTSDDDTGEINLKDDEPVEFITKDKIITAMDKGSIIHKFCQYYRSDMDSHVLVEDIVRSFGIQLNEDVKIELQPYIDNFIEYEKNGEFDEVYREKPFHLSLGNNYITGVIDRINIKKDRIEIVDFKTNRLVNKSELIEHYEPQLGLYSYAVEKILNKKVDSMSLLFLQTGENVKLTINPERIVMIIEEILEFMDFVDNNSNIEEYSQSKTCNQYCRHLDICKLRETGED
ncbi:hypothetical protein E9840_07885 [Tissierella creatinini]|nr:hypothetical protein E9840_07885 [Tissierella creatinini]TJX66728.1 hypothetical protein E8P77_07040 [Soehngenia saccharolytica]